MTSRSCSERSELGVWIGAFPAQSKRKPGKNVVQRWDASACDTRTLPLSRSLNPLDSSTLKRCCRLGVRKFASTTIVGVPFCAAAIATLATTSLCLGVAMGVVIEMVCCLTHSLSQLKRMFAYNVWYAALYVDPAS